ncbi:MAG: NAD(P)/FAD-dependent oxidoreductase [Anaerolineales bacterium]|nr:NAD(P)/FAD-dependent oxidoreductase [Anaerolineales bacterium]
MYDVAIIGAGPAGIAAAVQLQRYGMHFVLLERSEAGGLLRNANLVENYPGFPQGISGPDLVQRMVAHLQQVDVQLTLAEVESMTHEEGVFHLSTNAGEVQSCVLVVASGTKPHPFTDMDVPNSLRAQVLYEVHSIAHVSGKYIAIVGAGDAAFDYSLNLAQRNQVIILNRGEKTRCLPMLFERALQVQHLAYHTNTRLVGVVEHTEGRMLLDCITPNGRVQMEADILVGALGREPQLDFISPEFRAVAQGLETQGLLYWIGDVQNGRYRQTSIAVGDGVRAAMRIYHRLKEDL